jgi:hypothetical protein
VTLILVEGDVRVGRYSGGILAWDGSYMYAWIIGMLGYTQVRWIHAMCGYAYMDVMCVWYSWVCVYWTGAMIHILKVQVHGYTHICLDKTHGCW